MTSQSNLVKTVIVLAVFIALVVVWAINGYDDTWLYIIAAVIAVPASFFLQSK